MDTIWAPWRVGYILGEMPAPPEGATGCIFCDKPGAGNDEAHLIVARARHCFVLLNLYPYNNGHLMVAPYRHVARLEGLPDEEIAELMQVARRIEPVLRQTMNPDGFNIGMNAGRVAGAGIDAHLHLHIVPRWGGDTNFMPVLSDTKVIPQSLSAVRDMLCAPIQAALDEMLQSGNEPVDEAV
jgi:ATP adenylyltransferase